ncbi:MAG: hypothetical protein ACKVKJ_03840 [Fidelibacterota bacterium]|jgi:hypothetical protein|tara:strand:+ start:196 stop:1398 length:1203 start_codon:yes stop_codon:yes gene_type:complete
MFKKIIFIIMSMILSFSCEESNNETCNLYEGRGNLISYELIAEFSEGAFKILIEDYYGFDASQFKIENSAKVYKIVYESIDTDGTPTELSGAIYVPQVSDERALPTLKTAHYTITERNAVASVSPNVSPQSILGSMQGYFSIYADGIGYGISYSQASYVNKQASAIAGIDLLRASKEFACENNIKLNNQLFTSGYSAGGYGTMAFHQVIDEEYSDEFTITANAPLAGPYALDQMAGRIFSDEVYSQPYYLGFALWGYVLATGDNDALNRWVNPKYKEAILNMYNGEYSGEQINTALNDTMSVLLDSNFLSDFLGDGQIEFKKYLKDNSFIYGDWKPNAPIHFMHGADDETVFHFLMKVGVDGLEENGAANIQSTSYPGDHGSAAAACMINSIEWFNTMKE